MIQIQHPQFLGFKLGLKFRIAPEGVKFKEYLKPSEQKDVVYVALLAGPHNQFKKEDVIKVGETGKSLKSRWFGTLGIFNPGRKLRNNEEEDRRKWVDTAKEREVHVWVRPAGNSTIKYAKGFQLKVSTRLAEEEYLDKYYQTRNGQRLNSKENE